MFKKCSVFLSIVAIVMASFTMVSMPSDAEARRFGGGSSFGRQSSKIFRAPSKPIARNNAVNSQAKTAQNRSGFSRFLGPIAGIAAGLGIAALLSSLGLSGAFLELMSSVVLIAVLGFAIMFLLRRLKGVPAQAATQGGQISRQAHQPEGNTFGGMPEARQGANVFGASSVSAQVAANESSNNDNWFIPAGFDVPAFLQEAKKQFAVIQGLWDVADVAQLQNYVTDDFLKELTPELAQQTGQTQTEIVLLNAELLGLEEVAGGHLASVRFSGMLREEAGQSATHFEEVWNLYKAQGSGWLVAGLQQLPSSR